MPFVFEESPSHQWTSLQTEHDLLENWIKQPRHSGVVEYLRNRVADSERNVVLYYIEGIGMDYGRRFAMVYERHIIRFDVLKVWGPPDFKSTPLRIGSVEIPEELDDGRNAIKELLAEALAVYDQTCSFAICPTQLLLDYQDTHWTVIPKKYSWLYWKTESVAMWLKYKFKLQKAVAYATCPLVIALLLTLLVYLSVTGASVPIWSVFFVGAWLIHRMDRYDNDYRFLHWLIGVPKLRSRFPMLAIAQITDRLMNPVPLGLLTVQLHLERDDGETCTLTAKNHSWFFVPHLHIGATQIADAVAPGFTASLRAQNKGAIDPKKLEAVFPSLSRKWLFPRQSVQWQIRLLKDFLSHTPPSHITAIVSISKRASGELKHGPRSFLLPLTVV